MPISFAPDSRLPNRPNARGYAAELVRQVVYGGRSLDRVLSLATPSDRDKPLVHELTIGTVRHFYSLSDEVSARLNEALKPRDMIVFCLLLVGAYQLRHTRVPGYAAVNESVDAARQIGRPWARGLINHVLRSLALEPSLEATSEEAAFDHPKWLIDLVREDYPEAWREILSTSLSRAPLTLRVNRALTSREQVVAALKSVGVSAHFGDPVDCVVVDTPTATADLGLAQAWASVQDAGAMWAAPILRPRAGERVLDACAAPGGKAMHIIEYAPGVELRAMDIDADRCELVRAECRRHGLDDSSIVLLGDAGQLDWWDGSPFHRVLLDAPCSGSGTLRRHPDIKLLKRESDIGQYQSVQRRLLESLWRVVDVGGRLLYCTCSVLSLENDRIVEWFTERAPNACVIPIDADCGIPTRFGRQLLPAINGADGFYYSLIEKRSAQ